MGSCAAPSAKRDDKVIPPTICNSAISSDFSYPLEHINLTENIAGKALA
nr:hypothetical protein [Escherichia coli]